MEALEIKNRNKRVCFEGLIGITDAGHVEEKLITLPAFYLSAFCEQRRLSVFSLAHEKTPKPCCITFYSVLLFPAHEWCIC